MLLPRKCISIRLETPSCDVFARSVIGLEEELETSHIGTKGFTNILMLARTSELTDYEWPERLLVVRTKRSVRIQAIFHLVDYSISRYIPKLIHLTRHKLLILLQFRGILFV